jgi:cytochrome c oxidase subunit III
LDSQAIATLPEQEHAAHEHPDYVRHHFANAEQQRETANFGMWLFLLTEIMFFSGMFAAYLIYRNWYYPAFVAGSHYMIIWAGTLNTAVLICSSFTMAMGVYSAEMRNRKALLRWLTLTLMLGLVFLGIKAFEWHAEWVEHHVPGLNFSIEDFTHVNPAYPADKPLSADMAEKTQTYFSLYFAMTGMHALHMLIGCGILVFLLFQAWGGAYTNGHMNTIENFGLYWHFVDIVWIFLFPLLYLISRHQ